MSILSDFEDRLGKAIDGLFAGAFRSPVQPVEIAKALAREMDDGRAVGVGRVYAPTSFTVTLSADDADNLGDFCSVLAGELTTYLTNHAREHSYHLPVRAQVSFETDADLKIGRFLVAAELASTAPAPREPVAHDLTTVTVGDTHHDFTLTGNRVLVGRVTDCDLCVDDVNASRQHAAFIRGGDAWYVEDLGSTNGTKVNGQLIDRALLTDGDVITIGATRLIFHRRGG